MTERNAIERLANREYEYGFVTEIESEYAPKGLSEDVVRLISKKKNEPTWLLDWRLRAYRRFTELVVDAYGNPGENYPVSAEYRHNRMQRIGVDEVMAKVRLALKR